MRGEAQWLVLACFAGLLVGCGVEGDGAGEGSPGPGSGSAADEFFDRIDQAIDTQCDEEGYGLEMAGTPCPDFNLFASDCQDGERLVELYGDDGSWARGDYDIVDVGETAPQGRSMQGKACVRNDVDLSDALDAFPPPSRSYIQAPEGRLVMSRFREPVNLSIDCRERDGRLNLWISTRSVVTTDGWEKSGACLFDPSLNGTRQE